MGFIALHLGVGTYSKKNNFESYKKLLIKASLCGKKVLENGGTALEACTESIKILENDPLVNCGFGSNLTINGTVECDASIMDGYKMQFGACGAVNCVKNPIELAQKICINQSNDSVLLPPCILVGDGANIFAEKVGLIMINKQRLISSRSYKTYKKYKKYIKIHNKNMLKDTKVFDNTNTIQNIDTPTSESSVVKIHILTSDETTSTVIHKKRKLDESVEAESEIDSFNQRLDTVGAVCVDNDGHLASGVSSGGVLLKHPGRIGQACILGAGVWADRNIAVCTTGGGEHIIKTLLAKEIANEAIKDNFNLVETLKYKFTEAAILQNEHCDKIVGAILISHRNDRNIEFSWSHTDKSMGVAFMNTNDEQPNVYISETPNILQKIQSIY